MKPRLILVAIAVGFGIVGWRQLRRIQAPEAPRCAAASAACEQATTLLPAAPVELAASYDAQSNRSPGPAEVIQLLSAEDDPMGAEAEQADRDRQNSAADVLSAATDPPARKSDDESEAEVIRERYPNRAVKIEREVTQDDEGNYVNHGSWKMWDLPGSLVAEGRYQHGQRIGVWTRWYRNSDVELLKTSPYSSFRGPFISQASFDSGRLNGKWTIHDSHQRKISEGEFVDGQRQGTFTWWYPNGQKMRECQFEAGEMHGPRLEWAPNARLTAQASYEHGRKLETRTEKYPSGAKKSEGDYLVAREIVQTPDDWWNMQLAVYTRQGNDERHGPWITWYPNGQKQTEGLYEHDVPVGEFTWWYANGQQAVRGEYVDGEQQGKWVWWHENGLKSIEGEFRLGHPMEKWTWWGADGKVARARRWGGNSARLSGAVAAARVEVGSAAISAPFQQCAKAPRASTTRWRPPP